MRQVVCRSFGPVDDLRVEEAPDPTPGPGQVLVEVRASAVSFVDGLLVRGLYQIKPPLPYVPGMAVAGVVRERGEGVDAPAVGTRVVCGSPRPGGYVSHALVPAAACAPLPDAVGFETAASMIESYATALFALTRRTTVAKDEWVVVLGAAGGVGLATVDVARGLGARVIAAASGPAKLDAARAAGADATVNYADEDLKSRIREITGGGADIVVDPIGGPYAAPALRALAPHGRYLVIGFAAGDIPQLPANQILLTNRTVIGVDWGDHARRNPGELPAMLTEIIRGTAEGRLNPVTPTAYPLDQAPEALTALAERRVVGKLVLVPDA
ncbi:NADPH:quinone oxidoreductase family protein [Streptodolium elevatio]|uniref:NADPH:quinone oxidoreductase family protein n=1 Tax=Streptodolium elevatio TaxID=3157996 RepID=A0ABV3DVZ5_9ACTN